MEIQGRFRSMHQYCGSDSCKEHRGHDDKKHKTKACAIKQHNVHQQKARIEPRPGSAGHAAQWLP
eukprot:1383080-Pyramimonas_sp.AAC.1